ncbi:MAG: AAA family ATPase [Microcoleaceae cyanobacterium]
MKTIPLKLQNYQILDCLHTGSKTLVYRATQISENQSVILKILRNEYPSFNELLYFRNQYTITKNLKNSGIVSPYRLEPYKNSYILVMKDWGGISLQEYIQEHPLTLVEILKITIQLAEVLHELHQARVIHKDIKPANILIHPISKQVWLIDFSIASLLPKETQEIQNPNVLEGTLAYIAPEQTGRMNRGIDYRTDFYSLGVTLYELLTGNLPFKSNDPMELVHCHIAKMPQALKIGRDGDGEIGREEIPQILSEIVMKLMAKNAEDRYQSALGLKYDLEQCLIQYKETGKIAEFKLGIRDLSDQFLIPEKLYGREAEVSQLLAAFERVSQEAREQRGTGAEENEDHSEMMLVAGYSGVGKTAVINEVHKPITRSSGYFIKGKFDQFNRNIPFSAFVQAFRSLMGQLLSENDAELATWKDKIIEAVGDQGQVLIDVIPELESIIKPQPPAPELSGTAAQNRFNLLFSKFVHVFTTKEHPLVIFLDDLQWADFASLNLLKLLMSESETGYLLVLGAYRDNEVNPAHPLMLTLDDIQQKGAKLNTLTLTPLSQADINHLVADTLLCSTDIAKPLSQLVYQKTQGNPFFTTQFLQGLHEEGCITFDPKARFWQCDIAQVRQSALTDNVVEFMVGRLQKLSAETQNVLKLAACIGNQFDLKILAVICELNQDKVAANLWSALQEGFVIPENETYKFFQGNTHEEKDNEAVSVNYRFSHDRVQQAAYSLIVEGKKQETHLKIGQLLLENTPINEQEDNIFEMVNQLNQGIDLITEKAEQKQLAQLNSIAAYKAKLSTAYRAAAQYFEIGLELLPKNPWQQDYNLAILLYLGAAETAFLNGEYEQIEQFSEIILNQAKSPLEQGRIYEIQIQAKVSQGDLKSAISILRNSLQKFGIKLPHKVSQMSLILPLLTTQFKLKRRSVESLYDLPELKDEQKQAAIRLVESAANSLFTVEQNLFTRITLVSINLIMKSGMTVNAASTFMIYAVILCGIGDINLGYKMAQLAQHIVEKSNLSHLQSRIYVGTGRMVLPWKQHFKVGFSLLEQGYEKGLESGELEFAGLNLIALDSALFFIGKELTNLEQKLAKSSQVLTQIKQPQILKYTQTYRQAIHHLLVPTQSLNQFSGPYYNEATDLKLQIDERDTTGMLTFYLLKAILACLFNDIQVGIQNSALAKKFSNPINPVVFTVYFYDSLLHIAQYSTASYAVQRNSWKIVKQNQAKLKKWAKNAPENCLHKFNLVEAERYRILQKHTQAMNFYEQAISGAKENEYIQEEALANELAAKFYLDWEKEKIAQTYMIEAYYCYSRWGAKAKVIQLEQQYPELLSPILQKSQSDNNIFKTITNTNTKNYQVTNSTRTNLLDLTSVMKASQALSGEIELETLVTKLMQVILENAGATKGVLIFNRDRDLTVEAVAIQSPKLDHSLKIIQKSLPVEDSLDIPLKVINWVKRQLQPLMFDHVQAQSEWAADEYILTTQPQSLLCFPILNQGKLLAILYLENTLIQNAFTSERVESLKLLCSQAAISLENAELYRQAQQYSQQLQQSLTQLQDAQVQLVQSEKMSALGQMMSGITHEINNPLGFVSGNLNQLEDALNDVLEHLDIYQQNHSPAEAVTAHAEEIELEYLLEDLPEMVTSMKTGVNRIQEISKSMRIFSRADQENRVEFDLHEALDSTLLILKHRLKASEKRPEIQVIKEYGDFAKIHGFPGQLNQVFMNILANAIDMFDEMADKQSIDEIKQNQYQITLKTELDSVNKTVSIQIQDNGCGMPEDVKAKVFEHLYTTKAVGKGTGLGLSIARQIIVNKHSGKLECHSKVGEGTTFIIQIPA